MENCRQRNLTSLSDEVWDLGTASLYPVLEFSVGVSLVQASGINYCEEPLGRIVEGTETGEVHLEGPVWPGQGSEGAVWHFFLSCLILGEKKEKSLYHYL